MPLQASVQRLVDAGDQLTHPAMIAIFLVSAIRGRSDRDDLPAAATANSRLTMESSLFGEVGFRLFDLADDPGDLAVGVRRRAAGVL